MNESSSPSKRDISLDIAENPSPRLMLVGLYQDEAWPVTSHLHKWGFEIKSVNSHTEGLVVADEGYADIYIAHIRETDIDGFEFCRLLKRRQRNLNLKPLSIILIGEENDLETLLNQTAGFNDFIIAPYHPDELRWRIENGLRLLELERYCARHLREIVTKDLLDTEGLRLFLTEELNRLSRKQGKISLALLRIIGLDDVDMNFGTFWREWVEGEVASAIRNQIRNYDKLAMFSKNTFCLVVPEVTDTSLLSSLLERIHSVISSLDLSGPSMRQAPVKLEVNALHLQIENIPDKIRQGYDALQSWLVEQTSRDIKEEIRIHAGSLTAQGLRIDESFTGRK